MELPLKGKSRLDVCIKIEENDTQEFAWQTFIRRNSHKVLY